MEMGYQTIWEINKNSRINKGIATVTAVRPFSNFGELFFSNNIRISKMTEKEHLKTMDKWVFRFEKEIFNFIKSLTTLEKKPLNRILRQRKLFVFKHTKF